MVLLRYHSLGKKQQMRARMEKGSILNRIRSRCLFIAMAIAVWWLFIVFRFISQGSTPPAMVANPELREGDIPYLKRGEETLVTLTNTHQTITEKFASRDALSEADDGSTSTEGDPCEGRYIYLHELPKEFNEQLVQDCDVFSLWADMCRDTINMGFGLPMDEKVAEEVFSKTAWYATNQFALEVIFQHKVMHYECRTLDSAQSNALFVPYYSGFEVMPHLWDGANITHRDQTPYAFAQWLTSQPEWARMNGHDHFMAGGRVTWDFRRVTDTEYDWGNKLLLLDPVKNLTTLTIEASPWHDEDVGVPYPTYFHPTKDQEVYDWQDRVAGLKRRSLFCFAGAPRPKIDTSIRGEIMAHCKESEHCNLMECGKNSGKCHTPANVMRLFKESHFCLQPAGDSFTRRSLFDAILAGCIPVLFHDYSAYTQYGWFFPANHSSYSVFIDEDLVRGKNVSIEEVLLGYSDKEIADMREVVISLIPRIVYSNPLGNEMTLKDAFDISVDGVIERIREYQRRLLLDQENAKSEAARRDSVQKDILAAKLRLDSMLRSGLGHR